MDDITIFSKSKNDQLLSQDIDGKKYEPSNQKKDDVSVCVQWDK